MYAKLHVTLEYVNDMAFICKTVYIQGNVDWKLLASHCKMCYLFNFYFMAAQHAICFTIFLWQYHIVNMSFIYFYFNTCYC